MTQTQDIKKQIDSVAQRMPHAPKPVVKRMQDHLRDGGTIARGTAAALNEFYGLLAQAGLAPGQVTEQIYRDAARSRTRFRYLIAGLRKFAPKVPLAPSIPVKQGWDRWLNETYNKKDTIAEVTHRIGLPPEDWPTSWQAGLPALDRSVRPYGDRRRPLAERTKRKVISAVGLIARARLWAMDRGVHVSDQPSEELFEAFLHYLEEERNVSYGTARDYLESALMFFLRAGLLDDESFGVLCRLTSMLHAEANDRDPSKWARLTEFRKRFTLADVLHLAMAASESANDLAGNSAAAFNARQKGMIYALLVNTGDRQGDLREYRIGDHLVRDDDLGWCHGIRQGKTKRKKEIDALWPGTSELIDQHILGDRPEWMLKARLAEVDGLNLLTLSDRTVNPGYINRRLASDFRLHGHLVRTLIADLIRRARPDALWALQQMLGHSNRFSQRVYRADFDESRSVQQFDALYDKIDPTT